LLKGKRISTVDLLVLTSLDQLLFIVKKLFLLFDKTSNLNEEVNGTDPSTSVRVPWLGGRMFENKRKTWRSRVRIPSLSKKYPNLI
jgi:hypothetical protein